MVIEDNRNSCIELAGLAYNYLPITASYNTSQVTSVGYLEILQGSHSDICMRYKMCYYV